MVREVSLGVLISGGGTNLQAIIDAIENKRLDAAIRVVISNREDAYGLVRARNHGSSPKCWITLNSQPARPSIRH